MERLAFKTVQNMPPLQADLNPPCQFGVLWSRMIFEVMTFSFYFPCSGQCPWDQFVFHFKMTMYSSQLSGHEFEQTSGDGKGQGSLVCCSPWGCKESDMT